MNHIFDGNKYAGKILLACKDRIKSFRKNSDILPRAVAIQIGENNFNEIYINKKMYAFESVGLTLEIVKIVKTTSVESIINTINKYNKDKNYSGIMIQLPIPEGLDETKKAEIIDSIVKSKDFDGMKNDTNFVAPVVRAIENVLMEAEKMTDKKVPSIAVVGANGFVGRKIKKKLEKNYPSRKIDGFDLGFDLKSLAQYDVIISSVGNQNLIRRDMVKENSILIDVGYPKGDFEKKCYEKASFVSPVPGGVGPLTIAYLVDNFVGNIN